MSSLIACVPNFSEARRPEVVHAIVEAITSNAAVRVLDVSSDPDHNRTVVTFVGDAASVEAGAFAGIATAAQLINLDQHTGAHPRLGATDVVPFIPLRQATMEDCVAVARKLGARVGGELGIPVYLYEAAATRPERHNLETIRRGQYEGLKAEIATQPARQPDFGPAQLGPAGATVIGARPFLIAYNIYLNTTDVRLAKKVARAVRHSSGGLRYVKALGLRVGGQAQVSMNLTDFRQTPLPRVVEMVRREAARYGASLVRSELVGMIPQAALVNAAQWYLQLDGLQETQIIEHQLATLEPVQGPGETAHPWLEALAAGSATPGGGAAAAYAGAMAAALVAMVARLTLSKQLAPSVAAAMQATLTTAEQLRTHLTASVHNDTAAFAAVLQAYRLSHRSEAESASRAAAIESALHRAAIVPLGVARQAVQVLHLAMRVAEHGHRHALSDVGTAAHLALAAVRGAALNVQANATALANHDTARQWLEDIATLEQQANVSAEAVQQGLHARQQGGHTREA